MMSDATAYMQHALQLAECAAEQGEVPVGAVLVKDGELIAEGYNQSIQNHDPTAHAEIMALRAAGKRLGNYRLVDTTLYVTLEPCAMCVAAMLHARISRVVFAAADPKTGALGGAFSLLEAAQHNHRLQVTSGVMAAESSELLKSFFKARR